MILFDKGGRSLFNLDVSKAFASGGEGSICEHPTKPTKAIKVYHKERDLSLEGSLMELNKLPTNFIKPEEIYYTKSGKILGFSMQYVDMSKYVILKKTFNNTFCLQNGYDKKVKYKIYQNLKEAVEQAHQLGIYIGDLNPYNILVNLTGEVIMLDVDSFGTKTKPHNGVLLEDIRDWAQHPQVNISTDQYAFDVLTFWMFTLTHPFRGDYPPHKSLEERVCKKSSLLSNLPIQIPKCYQPFTNPQIISQFERVFQQGQRFMVDLVGIPTMPTPLQNVDIVDSAHLYIRLIAENVQKVQTSETLLACLVGNLWKVISVKDTGTYNQLYTITDAQEVYPCKERVYYLKDDKIQCEGQVIKNINIQHGSTIYTENNQLAIIDQRNDKITTTADNLLNGNLQATTNTIYAKSIQTGDSGAWQTIGENKWLLDLTSNGFNLIKTPYNIKNVYKRKEFVLIEHVENNKTRFSIGKINGLKWEQGSDLPEWRYFDVKEGYIFVPEDGKVNIINPVNQWKIVSTIECPPCKADSRIYHSKAGMLLQTNDKIYLINKK